MFMSCAKTVLQQCVQLLKAGCQTLTLGLLRGLEESPLDAPLTERDLTRDTKVSSNQQDSVQNRILAFVAEFMYSIVKV